MASLQQVVEQLALAAANFNQTIAVNGTSPSNTVSGGPLKRLTTIISALASVSALRDWAFLLVIGSLFEVARRALSSFWTSLVDAFFITAVFDEDDASYQWILAWLSKQPSWRHIRYVTVSTDTVRAVYGRESYSGRDSVLKEPSYMPAESHSYTLWYKSRWVTVTRVSVSNHGGWSSKDSLQLRVFSRRRELLGTIIEEAKRDWLETQKDSLTVWVSNRHVCDNTWIPLARRLKRPLSSIVLDPGVREFLVDDVKDFLANKAWYQERGIPFRRGYLLYGAPGSGKTSVIQAIAGELCLSVYMLSLSRSGLDDTSLATLLSSLPEQCIVLIEDIDAAFYHGLSREPKLPKATPSAETGARDRPTSSDEVAGRLSLSGILNAIDGIAANEGRVLFATTNKYDVLDPALCRPGRMDLRLQFHHASKYQAKELFKRFFSSSPVEATEKADVAVEEPDLDAPHLIDPTSPAKSQESSSEFFEKSSLSSYSGLCHRSRAPTLSTHELSALADQFAAGVPERQITMAALQGYLMMHKATPFEAVTGVSAWVEKELAEGYH
ncbi:P-loop containing nucleoside triphosphate hydrolase protein [Pisolithus croceorrhizus]|nr:P-loop containing nucleoside triphosphate hydrolase protein [Pisolithus croceorrhizus]